MAKDPVFQPLVLPNLTLKNRILRSNVGCQFDHYEGSRSWARINWDRKFGAGGVGAVISGRSM